MAKKTEVVAKSSARSPNAILLYALLTIPFFVLIALLPANKVVMHMYTVSANQYHVLLFLVELPLAAIWFAAFFGYAKLQRYAGLLDGTPQAEGFKRLARGSKWLALGLPVPTMCSLILNAIANQAPSFHSTAIILANYASLIFPVIAFTIMSDATHQLVRQSKLQISVSTAKSVQLIFVTMGVLYCYLTFQHLDIKSLSSSTNPYFLPTWLVITTIIAPYIYAWFTGLLTACYLLLLSRRAAGVLYRQAMQLMAGGLVTVIVSLTAVQYLRSVVPRTGHLSLNATLATIYIIYAITVAGFALMASGANRLMKIEEV